MVQRSEAKMLEAKLRAKKTLITLFDAKFPFAKQKWTTNWSNDPKKLKSKIKSGNAAMIFEVGESMMIITNEKDETTLLPQWMNHISIFHRGTNFLIKNI